MRFFAILGCLLLCGALAAMPAQAQQEERFDFTEGLAADGRLAISNHKGSITITTWDRAEVEIVVHLVADEDEELAPGAGVDVHHAGRTLYVETVYGEPERSRFPFGSVESYNVPFAHYEIRMPRRARLTIEDHKSEIHVSGLQGDVTIDTHKGEITLEDLGGGLDLNTHKGIVYASFSRFSGDTSIETHKGDVTVVLPEGAGFDLNADVGRNGRLRSDFRLIRRSRWDDEGYRGAVNGGGPRLHLEAHKGTFELRAR